MLPVSDAFLSAVRGSHNIVSRVRIVEPGFIGTSPPLGRDLKIISGSVTLDADADIRATSSFEVMEKWPNTNTTLDVVPYGTEVQITRGIVFGNGSVQRVPFGIFRLTGVEQPDAPYGPLRVTASDRMSGIIEAKLEIPQVFDAATTIGMVLDTLVGQVYPDQIPVPWEDMSATTGYNKPLGREGIVAEEDRFGYLDNLVKAVGKIWYFDYTGQLQVKNTPTSTDPVFSVSSGADGVLVEADRNLSREDVFNVVRAIGEALGGAPVYGIAKDLDPDSVTYYYGPFGKVPKFITSTKIDSPSAATAAAQAELQKRKGLPYNVDFSMVPNPALEPWDPVQVIYPVDLENQPHQAIEYHVLRQIVIGLGSQTDMQCNTRLTTNRGAKP